MDGLVKELEELLRRNDIAGVRQKFNAIRPQSVPRRLILKLTNLARRSGLPIIALKISGPYVRPKNSLAAKATREEMAEYAVALSDIGSSHEAISILEKLVDNDFPKSYLNLAYALFSVWRYEDSIQYLESFVESDKIDRYQRCIGWVNLAAAYIVLERYEDAKTLLLKLETECRTNEYHLLLGNSYELLGQVAFFQREYNEALNYLAKADPLFQASHFIYQFFLEKWRAIINMYQSPGDKDAGAQVQKIIQRARELKHWETMRDCLFHQSVSERSNHLFWHVYFGTMHEGFRRRMFNYFTPPPEVPSHYIYRLDGQLKRIEGCRVFDFDLAQETPAVQLKPGQTMVQLFALLTQDFFKIFPLGEVFYWLFPDEYFNPYTSPNRVHQAVYRFKLWLKKNSIPLNVVYADEGYRLEATEPYAVRRRLDSFQRAKDPDLPYLLRFGNSLSGETFSARDFQSATGVSLRKANLIIKAGVEQGYIQADGKTRSLRYRLCLDATGESPKHRAA